MLQLTTMSTRFLALVHAVAAALLLGALPASAHDHWLAPTSFRPGVNERVDVALRVGHPSAFEEQARDPARFVRFEDLAPSGAKPIVGFDGRSPAGILRPKEPGLHVLVFESKPAFVEIEPTTYARYLAEEGLDDVLAERERRGETGLPGRDSYRRFDKSLVCVAGGALESSSSASSSDAPPARSLAATLTGFDRRVGLALELVPETSPFTWTRGEDLLLRLELEGHPLAQRQVKLVRLEAPHTVLLARTDEAGRARFTPSEPGTYAAFAVHQRRAAPEQELEGDWDGLWASLTFALGHANETANASN